MLGIHQGKQSTMHMKNYDEKILELLSSGELSVRQLSEIGQIWFFDLYPELRKLENQGTIESRWEEGEFPRRRLYKLSNARVS